MVKQVSILIRLRMYYHYASVFYFEQFYWNATECNVRNPPVIGTYPQSPFIFVVYDPYHPASLCTNAHKTYPLAQMTRNDQIFSFIYHTIVMTRLSFSFPANYYHCLSILPERGSFSKVNLVWSLVD